MKGISCSLVLRPTRREGKVFEMHSYVFSKTLVLWAFTYRTLCARRDSKIWHDTVARLVCRRVFDEKPPQKIEINCSFRERVPVSHEIHYRACNISNGAKMRNFASFFLDNKKIS